MILGSSTKSIINNYENNSFLFNTQYTLTIDSSVKDIKKAIREYTLVLLMVDDKQLDKNTSETKGKLNFEIQRNVYKTKNQPIYFITDGNGTILKGPKGYCKKEEFIDFVQFWSS